MDRWLPSGYGFRRWALVFALGVAVIGLGLAMFLTNVYRLYILNSTGTSLLYPLTLQFIPHPFRELLVGIVGVGLTLWGAWGINRAIRSRRGQGSPVELPAFAPIRAARRADGPAIVAIGGGTGMPTLLRGLQGVTDNISAVVNVVDDGGSSGRLRRDLGILPPGDFRNNLVALSDVEPLLTELFQYRFEGTGDLEGHSFGNLFLVAMTGVTGSFEQGIREFSRVLAVRGNVLPSSLANIELYAELEDGEIVRGKSVIPRTQVPVKAGIHEARPCSRLPRSYFRHLQGGSHRARPGLPLHQRDAPAARGGHRPGGQVQEDAIKVYICNVATQPGETDGYGVVDHVSALRKPYRLGAIRLRSLQLQPFREKEHQARVECDGGQARSGGGGALSEHRICAGRRGARRQSPAPRPAKLAAAVMRLYEKRGGKGAPARVRDRA